MQARVEEFDDEEGPLTEGEFEEGLDDEDYDEDEYDEDADLLDEDDLDEDEEPAEQQGYIRGLEPLPGAGRASGQAASRQDSGSPQPWRGLEGLPNVTREMYVKLLGQLRAKNKEELTILVLGKYFTGKSNTVNSLLNEEAATRSFLNRDAAPPAVHSREAHGFKLTFVDAAGLNDADAVSQKRLSEVADFLESSTVDVVLYIDRLDLYRVDGLDEQVIQGITRALGAGIWNHAILGLTYAGETVNGYDWEDFATQRSEKLRQAVRKHGKCLKADLPVALIENSQKCSKNQEGERVLPNGTAWVPDLMQKIADTATSSDPFKLDRKEAEKAGNPNRKGRWLIPVIFAAQIAFKVFIFDRFISDDYITGDKHGPYDPNVVKASRLRQQIEKEGRKQRSVQRKPVQSAVSFYDSDSD